MDTRREKLEALKKEKNAVIMAHYYVPDEVQEIADYIGDSYYLSDVATKVDASVIVLCGVRFMGESAKILNPGKKVLLPDLHADCPMAHMAAIEKIEEVRKEYPDVAVVCYVNSTAELKSHSDVCVTSSNAVKIVKELPNHDIFFIPDEHLGTYVAEQGLDDLQRSGIWAELFHGAGQVSVSSQVYSCKHVLSHRIIHADRKSTRLNSSHMPKSRMPSSA